MTADAAKPVSAAPETAPEAAVIIPHYRDLDRLRRCLDGLCAAQGREGVEIVVVDNDSRLDLGPAARPGVRIVTETQPGAAAARNRGVAETTAARLFFLDSDCTPAPDWLMAARTAIEGADIVGGAVTVFDETPPPRTGTQAFETVLAFDQEAYVTRKGFSVTANLLTWRRIFEDVGGFRDGVSEDLDWCRRATSRGWRLTYAPEVAVAHPTRGDWPALVRKWRRLTAESFALQDGGAVGRLRWLARAVLVLGSSAVDAGQFLTTPRLRNRGERLRGLGVLLRLRALRAVWMTRQALLGR